MDEQVSFVKLNCLNCGASLNITSNLFEFACQYCGATQIVERSGGTIALKMLSDRIDRIEDSVEKTAAEIKLQKTVRELEKLEKKKQQFIEKSEQKETARNPLIAVVMGGGIILSGFLAFQLNSVIPIVLVIIVEVIIFWYLNKTIRKEDASFQETLNSYEEKITQTKFEINELKKVIKI